MKRDKLSITPGDRHTIDQLLLAMPTFGYGELEIDADHGDYVVSVLLYSHLSPSSAPLLVVRGRGRTLTLALAALARTIAFRHQLHERGN